MKPYECPECNGEGFVIDEFDYKVECPECFGSGLYWIVLSTFIERLINKGMIDIERRSR